MSKYWYDNFKDNPDFYSGYCRKLCRSLGLNELHIVKVLYFANLIHSVTSKYDDLLLHCGIRLPSETFTWKLREADSKAENFDIEAFLDYASDLADDYAKIDPDNLRTSLLPLQKYVQSSSKFELFVLNGDVFSFIDEHSNLPGLFVITFEDEYLFVSEVDVDIADAMNTILNLKKEYPTFDLHVIFTETKSDAELYSIYLNLKYLGTDDLNITLDIPEYSKSLKCNFENCVV
ncbi:hypothetical protein COE15_07650 [Bacillus cereus]|uniref:hypothetical protein n=1 Tax=Bacillus sp. AFS023182 TaxID=2033492 RepID=UPI000BF92EE9|nr:hypothetical protein [Bacillus sp. AFS023182]PFD96425.1 hypothetical protein CN288_24185 [Bacillus sp. AFS023182]PGY02823.1 hypothetical protein COE15_07650 [Bacillus cereus]